MIGFTIESGLKLHANNIYLSISFMNVSVLIDFVRETLEISWLGIREVAHGVESGFFITWGLELLELGCENICFLVQAV